MLHLWKTFSNKTKYINHPKVRNHCHYTRKYRRVAQSICNLKFNVLNEIPTVFHKLYIRLSFYNQRASKRV